MYYFISKTVCVYAQKYILFIFFVIFDNYTVIFNCDSKTIDKFLRGRKQHFYENRTQKNLGSQLAIDHADSALVKGRNLFDNKL